MSNYLSLGTNLLKILPILEATLGPIRCPLDYYNAVREDTVLVLEQGICSDNLLLSIEPVPMNNRVVGWWDLQKLPLGQPISQYTKNTGFVLLHWPATSKWGIVRPPDPASGFGFDPDIRFWPIMER